VSERSLDLSMTGRVSPYISFIVDRVFNAVVTFMIVTAALMWITLLVPAEERARNYLPDRLKYEQTESIRGDLDRVIDEFGLDDPFPLQYASWLGQILKGDWGRSPNFRDVLPAVMQRSPVTLELIFYSLLVYNPAALVVGSWSAWRQGTVADKAIRYGSYVITAIPPFILGIILITVLYVNAGWFGLSRIGIDEAQFIRSDQFNVVTGFLTIDGLINLRPDISWQAIRHLVLPVSTLAAFHFASLTLVTRAVVSEELHKEYLLLARSIGMRDRSILYRYALRNTLVPVLTHTALTAAQVVTGVYVVEVIFNFNGISELLTKSLGPFPDVPVAMGASVYGVVVVLILTLILDLIQVIADPRLRMGND
jgi:peptide/nickel transport system permease protein